MPSSICEILVVEENVSVVNPSPDSVVIGSSDSVAGDCVVVSTIPGVDGGTNGSFGNVNVVDGIEADEEDQVVMPRDDVLDEDNGNGAAVVVLGGGVINGTFDVTFFWTTISGFIVVQWTVTSASVEVVGTGTGDDCSNVINDELGTVVCSVDVLKVVDGNNDEMFNFENVVISNDSDEADVTLFSAADVVWSISFVVSKNSSVEIESYWLSVVVVGNDKVINLFVVVSIAGSVVVIRDAVVVIGCGRNVIIDGGFFVSMFDENVVNFSNGFMVGRSVCLKNVIDDDGNGLFVVGIVVVPETK